MRALRWALPVVATTLLMSGCSPSPTVSSPATPHADAARTRRFAVNGIKLTAELPAGAQGFHQQAVDSAECGVSTAGIGATTMSGEHDTRPVMLFRSTDTGCPDNEAINGSLPSWGSAQQLPKTAEAVRMGIPKATAMQFDVHYTQCTNSCYGATYRITFVTLGDGRTFYVTTGNVTAAARAELLDSITVRT